MKKTIMTIMLLALSYISCISTTHAQQSTFEFKKASQQYTVSGSITITATKDGYTYSTTVQNLPATKPRGGIYYILWGLTYEEKAENLGIITNNIKKTGTIKTPIKQFFISSEKEQFPEFISGPRIAQTDILPQTVFTPASATQSPTTPPTAKETPLSTKTPTKTPTTIKGPTGSPETGLGGALIWNGLIYAVGAIGLAGLTASILKKYKQK